MHYGDCLVDIDGKMSSLREERGYFQHVQIGSTISSPCKQYLITLHLQGQWFFSACTFFWLLDERLKLRLRQTVDRKLNSEKMFLLHLFS